MTNTKKGFDKETYLLLQLSNSDIDYKTKGEIKMTLLLELADSELLQSYIKDNQAFFIQALQENSIVDTYRIAKHHARANTVTLANLNDYVDKFLTGLAVAKDHESIFYEHFGKGEQSQLYRFLQQFTTIEQSKQAFYSLFDSLNGCYLITELFIPQSTQQSK